MQKWLTFYWATLQKSFLSPSRLSPCRVYRPDDWWWRTNKWSNRWWGKTEEKKHYYSSGLLTGTVTSGHAVSDEYDDDCDTDCAEHSQDDHSNLIREQPLFQRVICTSYTQWSQPEEGQGVWIPHWILGSRLVVCLHKDNVQALVLNSLNPKLFAGKS